MFSQYIIFLQQNKKKNREKERKNTTSILMPFISCFFILISCCVLCPILLYFISTLHIFNHIHNRHSHKKSDTKESDTTKELARKRECEDEKWHAHICIQSQTNCTSEFNLCTIQSLFLSLCCSVSIFPSLPSSLTPVSFQRSSSLCFTRCICKVLMLVDFLHLDYFAERKLRIV